MKNKDTLIDKLKSPIIRGELIKHIDKINSKGIAQAICEHLDIQMTDEDVKKVSIKVADKFIEFARAIAEEAEKL